MSVSATILRNGVFPNDYSKHLRFTFDLFMLLSDSACLGVFLTISVVLLYMCLKLSFFSSSFFLLLLLTCLSPCPSFELSMEVNKTDTAQNKSHKESKVAA